MLRSRSLCHQSMLWYLKMWADIKNSGKPPPMQILFHPSVDRRQGGGGGMFFINSPSKCLFCLPTPSLIWHNSVLRGELVDNSCALCWVCLPFDWIQNPAIEIMSTSHFQYFNIRCLYTLCDGILAETYWQRYSNLWFVFILGFVFVLLRLLSLSFSSYLVLLQYFYLFLLLWNNLGLFLALGK